MKSRKPLEILEFKGTACEVAFALGQKRRLSIRDRIHFWERYLSQVFRGKRDFQKKLEREFLRFSEAEASEYCEEIRAMAEGAAVPFADLFCLNLTELGTFAEKCTDLIIPIKSGKRRGILLAHNEDWDPHRNDVFILKARLPNLTYVVLAYDGYLPGLSAGCNSAGLCHSVNYVKPKDFRVGLPRIFPARHLVTATRVRDVLDFLKNSHRAFGQAIHLAQESDYWALELSARRCLIRRLQLPTVHSNHYLSPALKKIAATPGASSLKRYEVAKRLLSESIKDREAPYSPFWAEKLATRILSDRSAWPLAIWRENDSPDEKSATLASVLLRSDTLELKIFRDRPLENIPFHIRLERD